MNKCFITKLPSSVDNDNLPVLGQLRINWPKQSDLTDNDARAIGLSTNDSITVKVTGAHLTDSTLASNLGNTKTITSADGIVWLYVSNDADAILTIDNKYSLTYVSFVRSNKNGLKRSVKFDINDIRYCTALTAINLTNTQVSGDISAVSQLTGLMFLYLNNTQISGDISAISQLTALVNLSLNNSQVSGDINVVRQLTALTSLYLSNTQVSGDISSISQLTALTDLSLDNIQVSGKIDSLANLTKLTSLGSFKGLSLTGDMSKIPAGVNFISLYDRKVTTNFTWTADSRKNATLLAIQGSAPFDTVSMDNMFIDQATCTFKPSSESWSRTISVNGTRTSASDAAVATLQNMGVTITGVTKQA